MVTSSEQLPSSLRLKNQSCLHHIVSKQLQTLTKGNIKATGINGVFRIMRPKSDKPVLGYPIFSKPDMCQERVEFLQDIHIDDLRRSEPIFVSSPFYYRRNEYSKPKFSNLTKKS